MTPTLTPTGTAAERQKLEECIALTRFREASGQLPGILERIVQDPPDFLITDGSRTTSVEMTRYLQRAGKRGSPEAQREAGDSCRRAGSGTLRGGSPKRVRQRRAVLQDQQNQAA